MKNTHFNKDLHAIRHYVAGFVGSLLLTVAAYLLVKQHVDGQHQGLTHNFITTAVIILAFIQLLIQIIFFLHINDEQAPRYKLATFLYMGVLLGFLVIASLWIMNNLNYNMHPHEVEQYIEKEELIKSDSLNEGMHHH